jgi:hypothetical protein
MAGDPRVAAEHYDAAASGITSLPERRYLAGVRRGQGGGARVALLARPDLPRHAQAAVRYRRGDPSTTWPRWPTNYRW